MVDTTLEQQLIEQIRQMDAKQQQQVLDFARSLARPRGLSGEEMIALAQRVAFPPDDLAEITQAIEEGCERIDLDGWELPA